MPPDQVPMLYQRVILKTRGDIGMMTKKITRPTSIVNDTMDQITIATNMRGIIGGHILVLVLDQGHHGDGTSIEVAEEKGLVRGNGYQRIIGRSAGELMGRSDVYFCTECMLFSTKEIYI